MYAQLPLHGPGAPVAESGMLRNVTLKGFFKYAAQSKIAVVHLVRLNHLERFISLAAIDADPAARGRTGTSSTFWTRPAASSARPASPWPTSTSSATARRPTSGPCATPSASGAARASIDAAAPRRGGGDVATLGHGGVDASEWVPCAARVANWGEVAASREFNGTLWRDLCEGRNAVARGRASASATATAPSPRSRGGGPASTPPTAAGATTTATRRTRSTSTTPLLSAASFENKANFVAADGTLKDRSFRARLGPARPRGGDDAGEPRIRNDLPDT
ncbi:hypothetical protein JL721_1886 [Aureococcus anophagefferens]|nr:hypothetical protein JL721_1886 [Aureococcus anophagefferens]